MREKLIRLLDSLEYYRADDGSEYTPKQSFLDDYDRMIGDADTYFKKISDDLFVDGADDSLDEMKELFFGADSKEEGAYKVIAAQIDILQLYTVKYKQDNKARANQMSYEEKIDWMIEQLQTMMRKINEMLERFEAMEGKK